MKKPDQDDDLSPLERALVRALVVAIVKELRSATATALKADAGRRWMNGPEAAEYAGGIGKRLLYQEVHAKRLKAARIGGKQQLMFCPEWIDEWMTSRS